jgi:hypothetical protein
MAEEGMVALGLSGTTTGQVPTEAEFTEVVLAHSKRDGRDGELAVATVGKERPMVGPLDAKVGQVRSNIKEGSFSTGTNGGWERLHRLLGGGATR